MRATKPNLDEGEGRSSDRRAMEEMTNLEKIRRLELDSELQSVATCIRPLPSSVAPSEGFLIEMRKTLLTLDRAQTRKARAA